LNFFEKSSVEVISSPKFSRNNQNMSRLIFVLFFILAAVEAKQLTKRMTGSKDVSTQEFDSKLSSVAKISWYNQVCTGIAVHKNWVLTSAYCMANKVFGEDLADRMGSMGGMSSMMKMRMGFNLTLGRVEKVYDPKHMNMEMMPTMMSKMDVS
jgi:hypothetical protein